MSNVHTLTLVKRCSFYRKHFFRTYQTGYVSLERDKTKQDYNIIEKAKRIIPRLKTKLALYLCNNSPRKKTEQNPIVMEQVERDGVPNPAIRPRNLKPLGPRQ